MRYAVVFAVLSIGLTALADDKAEKKYTSKEGGFAVQFPTEGKVKTMDQKAPGGITVKATSVEVDKKAYAVIFTMFPEGTLKLIPAKTIFDGAEQGAASKGAKKVSAKDLEFGKEKFPGRELVVENDGKYIRTQMIIADPKLYIVTVSGTKEFTTGKEGNDFLKSFEIVKPAKSDE